MLSPTYTALSEGVARIAASTDADTPGRSAEHLRSELLGAWRDAQGAAPGPSTTDTELIRGWLDLVGREVVVDYVIENPEDNVEGITRRLDLALTLIEVIHTDQPVPTLEPGLMFLPLLEELVELVPNETWRDIWTFVELNSKRFAKNMPSNKGKALSLLRIINAFLRILPRTPEDLVFRGRVHQFASGVIGVADKSAINFRGDFDDLETTWEQPSDPSPAAAAAAAVGDVEAMEGDAPAPEKPDEAATKAKSEQDEFYANLWSIQRFFASPPKLAVPVPPQAGPEAELPWDEFKRKTSSILPTLFAQTVKERALGPDASTRTHKRDEEFFYPRYLTGRKLLGYELADVGFRRQVLVQFCILFQFLMSFRPESVDKQAYTGGMPKTFVLSDDDYGWVTDRARSIMAEMRRMSRDGEAFEAAASGLINDERYYASWKNEGSSEAVFEVPPIEPKPDASWEKRLAPLGKWRHAVGSASLSALWRGGYEGVHQLEGRKKNTLDALAEDLRVRQADYDDDEAMGQLSEETKTEFAEYKTKQTWRSLRLASRAHLRTFREVKKRDVGALVSALNRPKRGSGTPRGESRSGTAEAENGDADMEGREAKRVKLDVGDAPGGGGDVAEGSVEGNTGEGGLAEIKQEGEVVAEPSGAEEQSQQVEGTISGSGDGDVEMTSS